MNKPENEVAEKVRENAVTEVSSESTNALADQLVGESSAMAKYALSHGMDVDPTAVDGLYKYMEKGELVTAPGGMKELSGIHQTLAKTVYPATPRSIWLLAREQALRPPWYFLGPVPLIRRLSAVAILFLVLLLVTALQENVNVDNINLGLLHSYNNVLFFNQAFLLCAAGLGASFSALFLANSFIAKATYDPRYDSSYWSSIILGIIAGIILVELLPSSLFADGSMKSFGKPSLAMLGGFSSNVVYRFLQRLTDSLETLVKGSGRSKMEQEKAVLQVKAAEQKTKINAQTANVLVQLLKDADDLDGAELKQKLNAYIEELLPGREPV